MNIFAYQRIMLIGNNGSGKSYLSNELSSITDLPVVHLDSLFWRPNWEMPPKEEWIQTQKELVAKDRWIIDGNHTDTMEIRFQAADLIIFLDLNRLICIAGVLKRSGKKRSDMPDYLKERYDKEYLRFFKGIWNFSKTRKRIFLELHNRYPDKPFFVIKSRRKIKQLLDQWKQENHKC